MKKQFTNNYAHKANLNRSLNMLQIYVVIPSYHGCRLIKLKLHEIFNFNFNRLIKILNIKFSTL